MRLLTQLHPHRLTLDFVRGIENLVGVTQSSPAFTIKQLFSPDVYACGNSIRFPAANTVLNYDSTDESLFSTEIRYDNTGGESSSDN